MLQIFVFAYCMINLCASVSDNTLWFLASPIYLCSIKILFSFQLHIILSQFCVPIVVLLLLLCHLACNIQLVSIPLLIL